MRAPHFTGLWALCALFLRVCPAAAQPALWRTLGGLLLKLERPSESQEAWLEYQKRLPDDPEAAVALVTVGAGGADVGFDLAPDWPKARHQRRKTTHRTRNSADRP